MCVLVYMCKIIWVIVESTGYMRMKSYNQDCSIYMCI